MFKAVNDFGCFYYLKSQEQACLCAESMWKYNIMVKQCLLFVSMFFSGYIVI